MVKKNIICLFAVVAFLVVATVASANVTEVKPGSSTVCENASWIVYNQSETEDTDIEFDIGPFAYSWEKVFKRTLAPGGTQTNALAQKSIITNKGPGDISVNCQRQRFDRHDWKIDAGSGKTYQSNYHLDHVQPETYVEPGYGMPIGTERGIGSVRGHTSEQYR